MRKSILFLCLSAALAAPTARAADAPLTDKQRIAALEARLQAMETELQQLKAAQAGAAAPADATASTAPTAGDGMDEINALAAEPVDASTPPATASGNETASLAAPADSGNTGGNANAFNPAISIILNGSYSHHSLDPDAYVRAGFPLVGEGAPSADGFSLGESEISLAANIDDKLYGQLTLTAHSEDGEDHIGVEEAFVDTTTLPYGLSVRAGRFYSNIGYLNSHHPHTDSFFDRPLPYQAFLGNQYGDDGVQLRWIAPTPFYLELGGEVFRGDNYPAAGARQGGLGARTLFAHVGGSVGVENEWLAGVSMLKTKAQGAEDGFSGDGTLYIADGTWKWAPQGNFKDGGVTVRSEYFLDKRNGTYADPDDPTVTSPWIGRRRGAYLEGVYRFNRTWDLGYRYDRLWVDNSGPLASAFDPDRHSVELTWRNSEFSLVRLQLSRDRPNPDDSDTAITVQYQTALGAHGAHKF